jgi:hypothetical protein
MAEITSGGGRRSPASTPAEATLAVTPRAASRADSMACAMTDRQTLAVQRRRTADTANIQSLTVVIHVLLALVRNECLSIERNSGRTDDA